MLQQCETSRPLTYLLVMKIVILDAFTLYPADSPCWDAMRAIAQCDIYERTAPEQILERAAGAEIVLTNKVPMNAATIAALPSLRYIGVLATGYNIVDTKAAAEHGVTVTNIPAYSTASVAQHVFALLFAAVARVEDYAARVAAGEWSNCADFTFRTGEWYELAGKTMGIVAMGNIGRAVAQIAHALGMNVVAVTSRPEALPSFCTAVDMDTLFRSSDVVSLHCPLTPETKHLVNAGRLASMKPSTIIINTSRGPVVDEEALAQALHKGSIAAAAVDVLSTEPPAADNPLLHAPRCLITPHIAWASAEARGRLMNIATGNIKAFIKGEPVNVIK